MSYNPSPTLRGPDMDTLLIAFSLRLDDGPENWQFGHTRPTARHTLALAVRHPAADRVRTWPIERSGGPAADPETQVALKSFSGVYKSIRFAGGGEFHLIGTLEGVRSRELAAGEPELGAPASA